MKTQLLCTFTNEESFETIVEKVFTYDLFSRKIFVLKLEPSKELVVSYNIIPNNEHRFLPNTIMVHRKKETNTMYTINALNRLITTLCKRTNYTRIQKILKYGSFNTTN